MKNTISLLLLFVFGFAQAQENVDYKNLSLTEQFEELYKESSTYSGTKHQYKVVKIEKYNTLKKSVIDSLRTQEQLVVELNLKIKESSNTIKKLEQKLTNTKNNVDELVVLKNQRSIFGIGVEKSSFSFIIVLSYLILIALAGFFAFKYQQNAVHTKKSVKDLADLEEEFEVYKKNSLKRFQETNRKLQDELNKKWKKDK